MKQHDLAAAADPFLSPSARGAWIETSSVESTTSNTAVALRAGGVD